MPMQRECETVEGVRKAFSDVMGYFFRHKQVAFPLRDGLIAEVSLKGLPVNADDLMTLAQYILIWHKATKDGGPIPTTIMELLEHPNKVAPPADRA